MAEKYKRERSPMGLHRQVGRQRRWTSNTILDAAEEYLKHCSDKPIYESRLAKDEDGAPMEFQLSKPRVPTVAGFCAFIGLSRVTFYKYLKYNENDGVNAVDLAVTVDHIVTRMEAIAVELAAVGIANHCLIQQVFKIGTADDKTADRPPVTINIGSPDVTRDGDQLIVSRGGAASQDA